MAQRKGPKALVPIRTTKRKLVGAGAAVVIPAAVASAFFLGGTHSKAPSKLTNPPTIGPVPTPKMIVETMTWEKVPDATAYRLWLDGIVISITPFNAVSLPVVCGVKHRINAQPLNNAGVAALIPPTYFTPDCKGATT